MVSQVGPRTRPLLYAGHAPSAPTAVVRPEALGVYRSTPFSIRARTFFVSCIVKTQLPFAKWVSFCSKTREVHALGRSLDFNKGACRKSLTSGTRYGMSEMNEYIPLCTPEDNTNQSEPAILCFQPIIAVIFYPGEFSPVSQNRPATSGSALGI